MPYPARCTACLRCCAGRCRCRCRWRWRWSEATWRHVRVRNRFADWLQDDDTFQSTRRRGTHACTCIDFSQSPPGELPDREGDLSLSSYPRTRVSLHWCSPCNRESTAEVSDLSRIGEVPSQALIKTVLFPFHDNGFPWSLEAFWAYNQLFWAKAIPLCVFSPFIVCSQQQSLSSRVIVAMDPKTPPTTYAMSLGCNQELPMRRASHVTVLLGGKSISCKPLTRTAGLVAI